MKKITSVMLAMAVFGLFGCGDTEYPFGGLYEFRYGPYIYSEVTYRVGTSRDNEIWQSSVPFADLTEDAGLYRQNIAIEWDEVNRLAYIEGEAYPVNLQTGESERRPVFGGRVFHDPSGCAFFRSAELKVGFGADGETATIDQYEIVRVDREHLAECRDLLREAKEEFVGNGNLDVLPEEMRFPILGAIISGAIDWGSFEEITDVELRFVRLGERLEGPVTVAVGDAGVPVAMPEIEPASSELRTRTIEFNPKSFERELKVLLLNGPYARFF